MPFSLPLSGSSAREALGDMAHVVEVLNPANLHKMQDRAEALRSARRLLAGQPAAKAVHVICLNSSNDERWLIKVGPRGGWKKVWNFGNGRN